MSDPAKLPALPAWAHPSQRLIPQECYAELIAYGQACRDAALEEAAKVCEDIHDDEDFEDDLKAKYCAKAIRNRKG